MYALRGVLYMKRAVVVLALLCAIATLGVCQTSPFRWVNQQSESDQQNDTGGKKPATPLPPTVAKPPSISRFPCTPETNKEQDETSTHSEKEKTNFIKAIAPDTYATWALVIVGFGGIVYAARTLGAIKQEEIGVKKIADAALLNAQAVINAERAWMAVTVETSSRDDSFCFFSCLNQGRTPAKIVGGSSTHVFIEKPDDLPVPPKYVGIFAMPENTFIVNRDSFRIPPEFDPDDIINRSDKGELVKNRAEFLIFYGRILYEDVFVGAKVIHETGWCYAYFPDKGFTACGPAEYQQHT